MATQGDETEAGTTENQGLTRFANILGATFIGMVVTGLLLWVMAGGLHLGGGGIFYLVAFLVATVFGYLLVKEATETLPWLRIVIIAVTLGAVALVSLNWRQIGFEDPFVAPAIFGIFVLLAYFFAPGKPVAEAKSFKDVMEERLAERSVVEVAPALADEAPALADEAPTTANEPPAIADAVPARVTFYRQSKMIGTMVDYYINCDGAPVAKIPDGCRTTVSVPAGMHEITLTDEYGTAPLPPINLDLKPGEDVFVDCTFRSFWKGVTFRTVDRAEAERDMEGLQSASSTA